MVKKSGRPHPLARWRSQTWEGRSRLKETALKHRRPAWECWALSVVDGFRISQVYAHRASDVIRRHAVCQELSSHPSSCARRPRRSTAVHVVTFPVIASTWALRRRHSAHQMRHPACGGASWPGQTGVWGSRLGLGIEIKSCLDAVRREPESLSMPVDLAESFALVGVSSIGCPVNRPPSSLRQGVVLAFVTGEHDSVIGPAPALQRPGANRARHVRRFLGVCPSREPICPIYS